MPRWLSPELTAFLLKVFSYEGGGGPLGSMTRERIRELLAAPEEMARFLRAPSRVKRFRNELAELDSLIENNRRIQQEAVSEALERDSSASTWSGLVRLAPKLGYFCGVRIEGNGVARSG